MIDINVTPMKSTANIKKLKSMKAEGIVLHSYVEYFTVNNGAACTPTVDEAWTKFKFSSDEGMHYSIDAIKIGYHIPCNLATKHLKNGKDTYINSALYGNKANEKSIGVAMLIPFGQHYESIEKRTIKFLASLLLSNNLTPDKLMRGFDLNLTGSPFFLLDKGKWETFVKLVADTYNLLKANKNPDSMLEKAPAILADADARRIVFDNMSDQAKYIKKFQPDNRGIQYLLDRAGSTGKIENFTTDLKTNFTYSVTENPPYGASHCERAYDSLNAKATPLPLNVEPIYPDIIIPPGGSSVLVDSIEEKEDDKISSNVSLNGTDFFKRQKSFNIKDFKGIKKEVKGKPVNNNDPYPIDTKIKELESHTPKIKIDEVDFNLTDCNHPGSIIGPTVAKNFAMIQDELITLSKRTEARLCKIENNLATVTRNLFRSASRMHINCVYYGGQDVYGKYKNIRCVHDDRINDGQSMTLDQCLSCTRYEPIIGQIYAILDDNKDNVAQVLDDMQMSYMDIERYSQFSRNETLISPRKDANNENKITESKPFEKTWDKGFKMNWEQTSFDTQRPKVAEYKAEKIEAKKVTVNKTNEKNVAPEFKDVMGENEAIEVIKYSTENYTFTDFGDESGAGADGSFGMGANQLRCKIVEYAKNALKLCQEGKAGYSQGKRDSHIDKAINGVSYWDCSSLASAAYISAGINSIQGNTVTEYPKCSPKQGGIFIPASQSDKALPGDLVWFISGNHPSNAEQMQKVDPGAIPHVAIYIGNGEYIQAASDRYPLKEQINKKPIKGWDKRIFGFGRPRELVEADKRAAEAMACGKGLLDYNKQQFPTWVTNLAKTYLNDQVNATIKSLNKYGYKQGLIAEAKKRGLDPYIILGLIATESAGNPVSREGYWGIMQTYPNKTRATTNTNDIIHDIGVGCDELMQKKRAIKALVPQLKDNVGIWLYAYNAGEGTVQTATRRMNKSDLKPDMPLGKICDAITQVAVATWGSYKHDEVAPYTARVILRANLLRQKNALG